jgi:uncharacterized protein YlbG (UPF0298 family)
MYKFMSKSTFRKTYHTYVQIYVNKGHLEKHITLCTNLRQQRTFRKTYHTYLQIYVNKGHLEKRITRIYKFTSTKDI